jgi:hypothetical protein
MKAIPGKRPEGKTQFKQSGFRLSILEENLPVKSGAGKLKALGFVKDECEAE